ncbi:hypothetical protein [Elizabethkingia anophelis]|uniref:hypothetical protein n=1 Tax=Elizabethkingia anophelis TaxID=1117645 RepID=UPI003891D1B5
MKENKEKRRVYFSPVIEVYLIEMESGIAAGSATVLTPNSGGQLQEEWTTGDDVTGDIDW